MSECAFCAGKRIPATYAGEGTHTMRTMLTMMFGTAEEDAVDGIRLVDGKFMAFDNSSGEYAEQMVEINFCPMCGQEIK